MISNKILTNPENKGFYSDAVSYKKLTAAEQVIIETEWTSYLQRLVDFGNKRHLKNFSLKLEMEDNNDKLEELEYNGY
jgi:hypothetical protein